MNLSELLQKYTRNNRVAYLPGEINKQNIASQEEMTLNTNERVKVQDVLSVFPGSEIIEKK
jgi:hypothetical protein